jgi:hypothetical protein
VRFSLAYSMAWVQGRGFFALELAGSASNSSEELMPFKSEAQRRYFEANKAKLEKQGVNVKEWEESSKGLKLPERAPKSKRRKSTD